MVPYRVLLVGWVDHMSIQSHDEFNPESRGRLSES